MNSFLLFAWILMLQIERNTVDTGDLSCAENPCAKNATCLASRTGFKCNCQMGYYYDETNGCLDIDECINYVCIENSACKNSPGSYGCTCLPGYVEEAETESCIDYDECPDRPCDDYPCTNLNGSYFCTCPRGYIFNISVGCQDFDECTEGEHNCKQYQCNNTLGSYECICPPGFDYNISLGCLAPKPEPVLRSYYQFRITSYGLVSKIAIVFIFVAFIISVYIFTKDWTPSIQ